MPGPSLSGTGMTYETPPVSIKAQNLELYDYLLVLHQRLFGVGGTGGDQGLDNVNSEVFNVHTAPGHNDLAQGDAIDTLGAAQTAQIVELADAGGTYGAPERDLVNEIKADLNTFLGEYNEDMSEISDAFNALLTSLRNAKVIKT